MLWVLYNTNSNILTLYALPNSKMMEISTNKSLMGDAKVGHSNQNSKILF